MKYLGKKLRFYDQNGKENISILSNYRIENDVYIVNAFVRHPEGWYSSCSIPIKTEEIEKGKRISDKWKNRTLELLD